MNIGSIELKNGYRCSKNLLVTNKEIHMKYLILIASLGLSLSASARNIVDDLRTIPLNLDQASTEAWEIHYPNYRMGGGNGAGRELRDCLLLDVRHSDAVVTRAQKLNLARELIVQSGFIRVGNDLNARALEPSVRGNNVVFLMHPGSLYMTHLTAKTKNGQDLNEVIKDILPAVRGGNYPVPPVGLVYVRDCRF